MLQRSFLSVLLLLAVFSVQAQVCQTEGNMIKSVSTEASGAGYGTRVDWLTPTATYTSAITGYVIYEYLGGNRCMREVARITDLTATSYLIPAIAAKGYTMAVATVERDQPITHQHKQPEITGIAFNECNYNTEIQWTPYIGWNSGDASYAVYVAVGAGASYSLIEENIADTSFVWKNTPTRLPLSIMVQAVNKFDISAKSNTQPVSKTFDFPKRPEYIHLSGLVYDGNNAALDFTIDPSTDLNKFEIQRTAEDGSIASVFTFSNKDISAYTDTPGVGIFQYHVVAKNSCDSVATMSGALSNMQLQMKQNGNTWLLQWNNITPPEIVYTLLRLQPQPQGLLSSTSLQSYTDNVPSMVNEPSLKFCYQVEGLTAENYSGKTTLCANYEPVITMPDAIDPLSTAVNPQTGRARNQFGPVINVNPQTYSYHLVILNRNGAVVADINKKTTDDPLHQTWNGRTKNGNPAAGEVYTYALSVQFEGGSTQTKNGSVTVMYSN